MPDFSPKYAHFTEFPSNYADVKACTGLLYTNDFQMYMTVWKLRRDEYKTVINSRGVVYTDFMDCFEDLLEGAFIKKIWELIAEEKFEELFELVNQVIISDDSLIMAILRREVGGASTTLINSGKFQNLLEDSLNQSKVSPEKLAVLGKFWKRVGVII